MFETLFWWLLAAFVLVAVLGVVLYVTARWIFVRTAERMAREVDRRVGAVAAHTLSRMTTYAKATGLDPTEVDRQFSVRIDRLATLMDSAVRLPLIGSVGVDALLGLVPVIGDLTGAAVSLALVARTLRYGPPPAVVSAMLSNVVVDLILGAIPFVGVLADVWFKANERNAALMRDYLGRDV